MAPATHLRPTQKPTTLLLGEGLSCHRRSHGACLQPSPQNVGLVPPAPGSRSPSLAASSREMLPPPRPSASPSDESAPAPSPNLIPSPVPGGFPGHVRNMKGALSPLCRVESRRRRGEDCSGSA